MKTVGKSVQGKQITSPRENAGKNGSKKIFLTLEKRDGFGLTFHTKLCGTGVAQYLILVIERNFLIQLIYYIGESVY